MPAYVVYLLDYDRDLFGIAIEIMHRIASSKATTPVRKKLLRRSRRTRWIDAH